MTLSLWNDVVSEQDKSSGSDSDRGQPQPRVIAYSTCLVEAVTGSARRGRVQSVFRAAANILFPDGLLLSLNAFAAPRVPNSLQLSALAGTFPFTDLRVGQPVLLGANRLHIEALAMSLDLTHCEQWNPKISRPKQVDLAIIAKNGRWVMEYVANVHVGVGLSRGGIWGMDVGTRGGGGGRWGALCLSSCRCRSQTPDQDRHKAPAATTPRPPVPTHEPAASPLSKYLPFTNNLSVPQMAHLLCGRGPGLTPSGDDILAGWMAVNWLVHGPQPHLLAAYQQILAVAARQTHLLSQCWLRYAADGYVAEPIGVLLQALTREHEAELRDATRAVLALGATSGVDVIHGILLGIAGIAAW